MTIMVDIDGVLNDITQKALALYNSRSGKNLQMSDITTYTLSECLSKEDADGICALFKEKDFWDSLNPMPGSQMALQKLMKRGHVVYMATATDPVNFEWKCDWARKFFSFVPTDNIIRIMDKSLLRTDIMIDDHLDNLIGNICDRIVLDYPYNRSQGKDFAYGINRAHNWKEIVNIINDIERKNKEWEK